MDGNSGISRYVERFGMKEFLNDNLLRHLQLFRFSAYSSIFLEETEQQYFYLLVEGQVQCTHYHLNGRMAVVAFSEPLSAIGDLEVLGNEKMNSSVITTRDSVLLGIPGRFVRHYGKDDPKFLRFLIEQMKEKLYRNSLMQKGLVLPAQGRLALYLLAQSGSRQAGEPITLPKKESLSALLGTTERHLNRTLKSLADSGAIGVDYPSVSILDRSLLKAIVEE